jgi:hypothetical protein
VTTEALRIRPAPLGLGTVLRTIAVSGGVALAVNLLLLAAWRWVFDISAEFRPLTIGPQFTATLVAAFGGALTLALLLRLTRWPVRLFLLVSGVVFALSFVPVWQYAVAQPANPGVSAGALVALCVTHVTALACIVPLQLRLLTPTGGARGRS